jgi:hypothetical protein
VCLWYALRDSIASSNALARIPVATRQSLVRTCTSARLFAAVAIIMLAAMPTSRAAKRALVTSRVVRQLILAMERTSFAVTTNVVRHVLVGQSLYFNSVSRGVAPPVVDFGRAANYPQCRRPRFPPAWPIAPRLASRIRLALPGTPRHPRAAARSDPSHPRASLRDEWQ